MPERDRGGRNQEVIDEFRANGGQVGGYFADMSLLLLTTTGARSGQPHTTPLSYFADGDRCIVFAAAGGAPADPDWYHNLLADPRVTVEAGTEVFEATAAVATGEERDALFGWFAAVRPQLLQYQDRTTRQIPVVALTRRLRPPNATGGAHFRRHDRPPHRQTRIRE
jgi:deazaflavin-dependent oxidoreductase (nitroreductase family)